MIGIDVVDIARLRAVLARSPGLSDRLFTRAELDHHAGRADPAPGLAGTLAAKEAVIKALRLGPLPAWARRIEIVRDASGAPSARVRGSDAPGLDISITHDAGVAVAVAVAITQP